MSLRREVKKQKKDGNYKINSPFKVIISQLKKLYV